MPEAVPPNRQPVSAADDAVHTAPVRGAAAHALDAVLRAFVALAEARPEDVEADLPLEWCARGDEPTEPLGRGVEPLAGMLVRHVLETDDAPSDAQLTAEAEAVDDLAAAVAAESGVELPERPRVADSTPGVEHAGELVREVGLEALDIDVYAGARKGGSPVLAWAPVPAETAHIRLLGRLFRRIEAMVAPDPLLSLERTASAWYFSRWTGRGGSDAIQFTRGVREQEWSLVERIMVGVDRTALLTFIDEDYFEEVPERQRRLARALRRSFAGVFNVHTRRGREAVFADAASGRRYDVHEHGEELEYGPRFIGIGRLIPFDGTHLRSPGMVLLEPRDPSFAAELARRMARGERDVSRAIMAESAIAVLVEDADVPRRVRPARNRKAARDMLERTAARLEDAGLARAVAPEDVPSDVRSQVQPSADRGWYREYTVDAVLADWLDALTAMAQGRRRRP